MLPQLREREQDVIVGLALMTMPRICAGGREIWLVSWVRVGGMATD